MGIFAVLAILGLDGPVLAWLWADVVDGTGDPWLPALGIAVGLVVGIPSYYWTHLWFPAWWVRQMLRISARLVYGQTGPRRVTGTPLPRWWPRAGTPSGWSSSPTTCSTRPSVWSCWSP